MAKIIIYTDKIYFKDKEIKDPEKISGIIKDCISHLGDFEVFYELPPPKGFWRKFLRYMTTGM